MAHIWQITNTVEWYLAEADRYEWMGQPENILVSIGMAQKTLTCAMNDPERDPGLDLVYEGLQLGINKKREFYKDILPPPGP
jgi:hypothetical protein